MSSTDNNRERLDGPTLSLVPFDKAMINDRYISWLCDPEIVRFLDRPRYQPQSRDTVTAFVESFEGPVEKYMWAIVPRAAGESIGTCTLYDIHRYNGSAEFGLLIGEKDYWGTGASEEAIALLTEFAFERLGLRRITGGSSAKNMGMNFTFRKTGFTLEGRLREAMRLGDAYVDGYRWGLLVHEWREMKARPRHG
ncbi:MAG TPA: GNAT family N-acetyltransferase [Gemmatimonadaceae bacterium]|nr:GNAT family N-acetyltransferase [Gemmatimonadaceae bacterium]